MSTVLELQLGPLPPAPPKRPKPVKLDKTVASITTAGLIKWLQKVDPSGRLKVDVGFDYISVVKPKHRGEAAVIATLTVEGW